MLTALTTFSSFSVDNLEKAREFYIGTLDLAEDSSGMGDMGLGLVLPGGGQVFIYEKPDHEPASFTVLNFVVEDIDDTIAHMTEKHEIEFLRYDNLPADQDEKGVLRGKAADMGPDIAWFEDPAGNVLSIIEN